MDRPILSVIMANYNHGHYLEDRLNSILSQLDSNMEIIVVDDGSTDNSVEILDHFSKRDARVKVITFQENKGVIAAANAALQASRGIYVTSIAADDIILPGFIEKTLNVLLENPEITICFSDFGYVQENESIDKYNSYHLAAEIKEVKIFHNPNEFIKFSRSCLRSIHIPSHTAITKREAMIKRGGFIPSLAATCDWYLNHAIAFEEGSAYIPETLSVMRMSENSYTVSVRKDVKRRNASYLAMLDYLLNHENKKLYRSFKVSCVLDPYLAALKDVVLLRPKYWGFCLSSAYLFFVRKYKKFLRSLWKALCCQ